MLHEFIIHDFPTVANATNAIVPTLMQTCYASFLPCRVIVLLITMIYILATDSGRNVDIYKPPRF